MCAIEQCEQSAGITMHMFNLRITCSTMLCIMSESAKKHRKSVFFGGLSDKCMNAVATQRQLHDELSFRLGGAVEFALER